MARDMVTDLPSEVEKIANHLDIDFDHKKHKKIASDYSLKKQKDRINEAKKKGESRQRFSNGPYFDPHTNLHTDHINAGTINGWENVLTRQQITLIEYHAGDWLVANGYKLCLSPYQGAWNVFRFNVSRKMKALKLSFWTKLKQIPGRLVRRSRK